MADIEFTKEELETEEWRDVVGYEGIYSVSNLGRMRRDSTGLLIKIMYVPKRYGLLTLYRDGRKTTRSVHSLVAEAFIGLPAKGDEVNHIDTNKHNNRSKNLEYRTRLGNAQHASENGLYLTGKNHPHYRTPEAWPSGDEHWTHREPGKVVRGIQSPRTTLRESDVLAIFQRAKGGEPASRLAKEFSVTKSAVQHIKHGRCWRHVTDPFDK